jgi:uncharacterized protein YbjT (DUF2867 family)
MKKKKVLLAGATGYLGRYLAQQLKMSQFDSLLLVRNIEKSGFEPDVYELAEADLCCRESLHGLCKGVDYVISTVGLARQKEDPRHMDDVFQANANLVDEAVASGVRKFMYISVLYGDELRHIRLCETKEKLVDYLKTSGLDYCVVRPNGFFSDMKDFLRMALRGWILLFGNGKQLLNPIHGDDLARICVRALEWNSKELEIGGPDLLTQNDIARLALFACNRSGRIIYLPDWIRKLALCFVSRFSESARFRAAEFYFATTAMDLIAPKFGREHLDDFFLEESNLVFSPFLGK